MKKSLKQSIAVTINSTIQLAKVLSALLMNSKEVKNQIIFSDLKKGIKELENLAETNWNEKDLNQYSDEDKSDIVIMLTHDLLGLEAAEHVLRLMNIVEIALMNLENERN